jgi:glycosyltransferase involved in cell wall biosynthesis
MTKISVVIITFNEEKNIGRCLESVKDIADDIVVVDSYSTDDTEKICRQYDVRFIQHPFEGHIEQKNWAITQASYPHILSLDADEMLSDRLKRSISEVKGNWQYDGYYFNRLTNYCGKWIRYSSWYPSRKLRLWDSRKGQWGGMNPHDHFILDRGSSRKFLRGDLLHYSYYSIQQHIDQINKFSDIAAKSFFEVGKTSSWFNIIFHPMWRMFRDYIIKFGFMDGFYGLVISVNSAHETFLKYSKLRNLNRAAFREARNRICFFNSLKTWGGGERWHFDHSTRMAALGYDIIAFAHPRGELYRRLEESELDHYAINVSNLSFLNPFKILHLRKTLRREKVKTLVMNLSSDLKVAGIAAKLAGVENIIYRRANAIPTRNTLLNRFLFSKIITRMIANSEETKRCVLANNPSIIEPARIRVIYPGIGLSHEGETDQDPVYSREDGEILLGNAGRLSEEKGQIYLIHLAEILKEKGMKFRILIAGSGKLKTWLKKQARQRNVQDEVVFLGFIDPLKQFYMDIDIFLLSSLWEGFGYVMVEAMAEKKPVIAFDINSSSEVVDDGNSGYLVPRGDVEAMAEKVLKLAGNPKLREEFGQNGFHRVERLFSIDNNLEQVRDFLSPSPESLNG